MRYYHLIENKDYALAKKAFSNLSGVAQHYINSWEWANWDRGDLSTSFETNSPIAQEIIQAFAPVREDMKRRYGKTIKLYRGIGNDPDRSVRSDRQLFSWTSSRHVAELFAGKDTRSKTINAKPVTDQEIENALRRYEKTGFTTFRNKKYKVNKQNPQYYDIYDRHNNYVTDGDDLRKEFEYIRDYIEQVKDEMLNYKGKVVAKEIPIDDIIWVIMGGGSNEYIVRGHPQ
jgi:hypothetical protein